jgi:putative phosphoribosyl transferase
VLVERLDGAIDWVLDLPEAAHLPLAMFGSGSGAEALLDVAAERGKALTAIAAAGLGCDHPPASLRRIAIPTLLVAAEKDPRGLDLAKGCLQALPGRKRLEILHGTGNVSNSLDKVARLACLWFEQYLV